jgi:hypothetical protein
MKLKHLFIIHAIIALGYAVCNLFTPRIIVSIYFVNDTPTAEVLLSLRYFSWGLLSVGLITAFAAAAPISELHLYLRLNKQLLRHFFSPV